MANELTPESLRNVLLDVIGMSGTSGRTAPDVKGDLDWTNLQDGIGKTAGAAGVLGAGLISGSNALGKIVQGSYSAGDALGDMNGIVGAVGGRLGEFGTGLANGLKNISTTAVEVNNNLKKLSNNGVYFANDLGKYSQLVTGARTSMDHFNDLVTKNGSSLGSFGGNMDQAAENYLKLARDLQQNPIASQLEKTGMDIDELGDTLLAITVRSRNLNLQDDAAKRRAIEASLSLSVEMDNMSRLTGISRREMEDKMQKDRESAAAKIAEARMTPEQRAAYEKVKADALAAGGDKAMTVAAEAFRNQIFGFGGTIASKAGTEAMQAAPEQMAMYQNIGIMQAQGQDTNRQLAKVITSQENLLQSQDAAVAAAGMSDSERTAYLGDIASRGALAEKVKEAQGDPQRLAELIAAETKKASDQRKENVPGQKPEDASALSNAINMADRSVRDFGAAIGTMMPDLNKSVGQSVNEFNLLTKAIQLARSSPEEVKKTAGLGNVENIFKGETEGRANGSLGSTGNWIEDFGAGTLMELHGKEGVVTEGQFNNLKEQIESIMTSNGVVPTVSNFSTDDFLSQIKTATNPLPINDSGIFNDFLSQVKTTNNESPKEENGFFNDITNMFYDVGNIAGKMFDEVTTTTKTLGDNVKYQPTKNELTPAEQEAKLRALNTPEKIAEKRAALEKEQANKKIEEQKAKAQKNRENANPEESKKEPVPANVSLNDLRDQLIELNKNVKDLITHTDRVADHTGRQLTETRKGGSRI